MVFVLCKLQKQNRTRGDQAEAEAEADARLPNAKICFKNVLVIQHQIGIEMAAGPPQQQQEQQQQNR